MKIKAMFRLLYILVLLVLLLFALPAVVQAQFIYTTNNGTITIMGYSGSSGTVTIPDRINNLLVTSIGSNAFMGNTNVSNVMIPNAVNSIGSLAFFGCNNLTNVTIGSSVSSIGLGAFQSCSNLITVYFTGNAPILPDSNVFSGDNSAIAYYLAGTMGWGSTYGNELPTVVWEPFTYSTNNGTITITGYTGSGSVVAIPNTINGVPVTTIDTNALESSSLASVLIPNSVTNIGDYAFYNCSSLMAIYFQGNAPSLDGSHIFSGDSNVTVYYLPGTTGWGSMFSGLSTVAWVQFTYTTNNGTITITGYIANGGAVIIPSTISGLPVTSINNLVFYDHYYLTSVIIANSITNIGPIAFNGCSSMTNVTIGTGVTSIGNSAFDGCASLTSVIIPGNVTSIGTNAFTGCTGLTNLTISNGVSKIKDGAFYDCTSLTSVTIPNSVTSIESEAFEGCGLTSVYFTGNALTPTNDSSVFASIKNVTVYYLPSATGWGITFDGRPTALWLPQEQTYDSSFSVQTNQFGFNINWASGETVVVEACTNLLNPIWSPVATNTLTSGSSYFSDPQWTNYPFRFYRLSSQ
jgi:hypothetical protein